MTVRIHNRDGSYEPRRKRVENDGRVTLIKPKNRRDGWRPLVGELEPQYLWFGRTKWFTDVFPDGNKTFRPKPDLKPEEAPTWDKNYEEKLFEAKVIKASGESGVVQKTPFILYVILLIGIAAIVVPILLSGRIRIG